MSHLLAFLLFVLTGLQQGVDGGHLLHELAVLLLRLLQLSGEGLHLSVALLGVGLQSTYLSL